MNDTFFVTFHHTFLREASCHNVGFVACVDADVEARNAPFVSNTEAAVCPVAPDVCFCAPAAVLVLLFRDAVLLCESSMLASKGTGFGVGGTEPSPEDT